MSGEPVLGIIGGSGLYEMEGLEEVEERWVGTPWGAPSDAIVTGRLGGVRLAFLPRHGRGHRVAPSELNVLANIHALRQLGACWVISVSAVGSMREGICPGDMVVPDQLVDRTRARPSSFFGEGCVAHVAFADPYCPRLRRSVVEAAGRSGATVHDGGTYVCIEGPQFSTRAESRLYRQWGADVIGMTALPEARLAREAELCYATLALSTDYDCWHEGEPDVSVEGVVAVIRRNVEASRRIIREVVGALPARDCPCGRALEHAIMTSPDRIPPATRERLALLVDRYLPPRT
ncbi:MAG: S-methyl-5'-thioadenosine phosphorylase [Planctomycetes bacterium]|nr:S-methyl-5'-thioadenosine phosphorylase [Planctomycetota bacterium]